MSNRKHWVFFLNMFIYLENKLNMLRPPVVSLLHIYQIIRLPFFILVFSLMPLLFSQKTLKFYVFNSLFIPLLSGFKIEITESESESEPQPCIYNLFSLTMIICLKHFAVISAFFRMCLFIHMKKALMGFNNLVAIKVVQILF